MKTGLVALAVAGSVAIAQPLIQPQTSATVERLRGVSAASERVIWASGNNGTVMRSIDGGDTWQKVAVPGAEELDLRDIEAFDASNACILSIGAGDKSRIYRTADGGATWVEQFVNANPKAFYDAIAFFDPTTGLAFGDPVDGRFTVIRTVNGGRTWTEVPAQNIPPALEGEGAFAASGTCLTVLGRKRAWFGTGGAARARVFRTTDAGLTWKVADTPIRAGVASAGIFSITFADSRHGVAVGGDYRQERMPGDNIARTDDGGKTWTMKKLSRLRAYRSAVAFVPGQSRRLLAVGPSGVDWSVDGASSWTILAGEGYHALSIAPKGGIAWAVGENGRVAKLIGLK